MDQFPEELTYQNCMNIIRTNQNKWTREIRKVFSDKILKAAQNCDRTVELEFPRNLWPEHKIRITKELLDIFGDFQIKTKQRNQNVTVTKLICDHEDISKDVDSIIIMFCK